VDDGPGWKRSGFFIPVPSETSAFSAPGISTPQSILLLVDNSPESAYISAGVRQRHLIPFLLSGITHRESFGGLRIMRYTYLFCLLLALCLLSCSENNPLSVNAGPVVIIPLSAGNTWTYVNVILDVSGDTLALDTATMYFQNDTLFGSLGRWEGDIQNRFVINNASGFWRVGAGKDLFFKYPAQNGDSYLCRDTSGRILLEVKIISTGAKVTAAGATHSCYIYQFYNPQTKRYVRYVVEPNVGIIAMVVMEPARSGGTYTSQFRMLISYEVNPAGRRLGS